MAKVYFSSVIVWMVIVFFSAMMCKEKILENGWIDIPNPKRKTSLSRFVYSFSAPACVPFVRLFVVISFFYMATHKKEA